MSYDNVSHKVVDPMILSHLVIIIDTLDYVIMLKIQCQ